MIKTNVVDAQIHPQLHAAIMQSKNEYVPSRATVALLKAYCWSATGCNPYQPSCCGKASQTHILAAEKMGVLPSVVASCFRKATDEGTVDINYEVNDIALEIAEKNGLNFEADNCVSIRSRASIGMAQLCGADMVARLDWAPSMVAHSLEKLCFDLPFHLACLARRLDGEMQLEQDNIVRAVENVYTCGTKREPFSFGAKVWRALNKIYYQGHSKSV